MYRYLLCSIDTHIEALRIAIQRCITVLSHLYQEQLLREVGVVVDDNMRRNAIIVDV